MPNTYEERTVNNVPEYLTLCMDLRSKGFWAFRGQRKQSWQLGLHDPGLTERLDENLEQFKKRCREFRFLDFIEAKGSEWDWLFYAQHHRLRTRLLDWTSNPLVALYYAVETVLSRGCDKNDFGAVWALKVKREDFLSYDELPPPSKLERWVMINPIPVTHRLARQSGKFSYHPDGDSMPLDTQPRRNDEETLLKIGIGKAPGENPSREIRRHLGIMNVHYAQMFLNPDGIARFINWEWGDLQH